ncbi:MAG TPA: EAL domain-containing protein [Herbaspirillum sp.]|uniref:putative bifunctional diguanylate cyclase/phosphodiesterase n=1 Tax=Herbaspirillum sp. TaxID=1890675 RepID=UPI002D684CBB|nr:EAL domain-containing protein [Herbaspirillum sp.]HZG20714.1 EAL domain-containing protein [Herbaspirillum sp.]
MNRNARWRMQSAPIAHTIGATATHAEQAAPAGAGGKLRKPRGRPWLKKISRNVRAARLGIASGTSSGVTEDGDHGALARLRLSLQQADTAQPHLALAHVEDCRGYLRELMPTLQQLRVRHQGKTIEFLNTILTQALHDVASIIDASIAADRRLLDRYRNYAEHIFNYTPNGLLVMDGQCRIRTANPVMRRILGLGADVPVDGMALPAVFKVPALYAAAGEVLASGVPHQGINLIDDEGHERCGHYQFGLSRFDDGDEALLLLVAHDIARVLEAKAALADSEERFRLSFHQAAVGLVHFDAAGRILRSNRKLQQVLGYDANEMQRLNLCDLADPDEECDHDHMTQRILNGEIQDYVSEKRYVRKDGQSIWGQVTVSSMRESNGEVHFIAAIEDITERKATEYRMRHLANHDHLTGLPNRSLMMDRLDLAIAQARLASAPLSSSPSSSPRHTLAVLFIDLDRFKTINDSLGHDIGDQVIVEVAHRLLACVRPGDTVARLGGDEFVVVLANAGQQRHIAAVADRILEAICQPMLLNGHDLFLGGSIGISLYDRDGSDSATLLKNADTAMYQAKQGGKRRYVFYANEMSKDALQFLRMDAALRRALERREFHLVYQPQVSIASGRIIGFEALLRWQPPGEAVIAPDQFIGLAEETGLIVQIGEWVLETACRQLVAWQRAGLCPQDIKMSVNLSATQFRQDDMVATVQRVLAATQCPPHCLVLEITESVIMDSPESTVQILNALSAFGVQLAIDDFGTGYSSLSYLKRFPIHTLKIDRSFIRDISIDGNDAEIVKAVIALAHAMNRNIVAEGVEDSVQLDFLRDHGCDQAQGYFFGKGIAHEEAAALLSRQELPLHSVRVA